MLKKFNIISILLIITVLISACAGDRELNCKSDNYLGDNSETAVYKEFDEQVVFENTELYKEMISTGKSSEQICNELSMDLLPADFPAKDDFNAKYFPIGGDRTVVVEQNLQFTPNDKIELEGINKDILPIITNSTPMDDMCSKISDTWIISASTYVLQFVDHSWVGHPSVADILSRQAIYDSTGYSLPMNFLRQMKDTGFFYTVDLVNDNGRLYSIFGPGIKLVNGKIESISKDITDMYYYGSVYCENNRSLNDFSDIKLGSSIYDVIKADSSAQVTLSAYRYYRESMGLILHRPISSVILLNDGIIEFVYMPREIKRIDYYGEEVISNETDDLIVSEINFYPDFKYIPSAMKSEFGIEIEVPIQILEQDYPPVD